MTKIKLFQLRLFRTIRRQICSIDMIDIETFTNIFRLLNHVDRSIIEKYIQGYSIKSIADESEYSKAFVSERIYVFQNELKKEISKKQSKYNPQIQISAESETKRSIFREKDKTKRSKKESAQHSKSRNKSFVMTSVSAL